MVETIINLKIDVNDKRKNGNTPMHDAATHGSLRTIRELIKHGGDMNKKVNRTIKKRK